MGVFKKVVDDVVDTVKKAGGDVADAGKKAGGDLSDTWKKAGGDIADEWKRVREKFPDLADNAEDLAIQAAMNCRESRTCKDHESCIVVVTAALAAAGAEIGGPWGAAVGGGAGIALAGMACRAAFPAPPGTSSGGGGSIKDGPSMLESER